MTTRSQIGCRPTQCVQPVTCFLVNSSAEFAQANSEARMASPPMTISQPGPGNGIRSSPPMMTSPPTVPTATRYGVLVAGLLRSRSRRLGLPWDSAVLGVFSVEARFSGDFAGGVVLLLSVPPSRSPRRPSVSTERFDRVRG